MTETLVHIITMIKKMNPTSSIVKFIEVQMNQYPLHQVERKGIFIENLMNQFLLHQVEEKKKKALDRIRY